MELKHERVHDKHNGVTNSNVTPPSPVKKVEGVVVNISH